ncbi:RNA polymerase sigma factor [Aquimarina spongiae]|uniref:RNA polymerase sigma factor, sigma-70 family n=1 Tax=Aquimarina spongiae TaxID=570521 RepID=A0A1M6EG04_9FLAO|nr:sigma-70 family RNA polymerase sigma factor [Aquimarina spongiae]SHI84457.1 RNA polymerase sigma factor, sigma-70 family [Aquimarina spongiae]
MRKKGDDNYLEGLLSGNDYVIKQIYEKIFPSVLSFVRKNKGTYEDAEEIFQDALFQLTVRVKVRRFEIKSTFEGYLFTVCKNLWRKELNNRKKVVRNEGVIELVQEEEKHSSFILEQERWELFEEKIKQLSENCMKLLREYFNKVPYDVIVEKFNYSSENVAFQRVFKCKKRLKDLIKKDSRYRQLQ